MTFNHNTKISDYTEKLTFTNTKPQGYNTILSKGSLSKYRKKAMGHSSLNVSLTYLRGLEIAELTEEDMQVV